jgi:hypothetical protein
MEALARLEREDPKASRKNRRTVPAPVGVMHGKAYGGEEVGQRK